MTDNTYRDFCLRNYLKLLMECLKELAQCGAVIIRMMDFVKKEMEGKAV